ncbi:D-alanyl-D-alanine carboxypeptidase [Nocardia caishijiensis]|uniref:D-alanyl-D-alanine carboxypeptidase n=2 Tax=Nocardia caishijiensis TaxID=184756 RepID=A0ABQ6YMN5_9NOCA|nr:D-alanyl-D-alanine carboxypeptidase [Nocardia caishijiensis]
MWLCTSAFYRLLMLKRRLVLPMCAIALLLTSCTTSSADAPVVAPARLDSVRADLAELIGSGAVGAVATITDNGATAVVTAGVTDLVEGAPIPDDRAQHVRVGSITKTFTAAIVLQLVEEGLVVLDAPVERYLPGLLRGDGVDANAITVRQLLGHRSGLPLPRTFELTEHQAAVLGRTFTPEEEMTFILGLPAEFAPGARFQYNNTNYLVAGMLIEAVTGRSYSAELTDRIIAPLGLSHTYLPTTGETGLRSPHLSGYTTVDGNVVDETLMEPSLPWTSGALVSTGADLNRFYLALVSGQVVPPAQLRHMLDGVDMGEGNGMSYGLGIGYTQLPCGTRFIGHTGNVRGFGAIAGATTTGRAFTYSYTGTPTTTTMSTWLTSGLCG